MLDGFSRIHSIHYAFRAYASMLLNRHFNPQLRILSIMASNQRNIITTLCMMASNTMHDNMGTKLDNVDWMAFLAFTASNMLSELMRLCF